MSKEKYVYLCGVDWQHEIDEVPHGTRVYGTIKDLKERNNCWRQCGIVRLKVTVDEWVEEQNLFFEEETEPANFATENLQKWHKPEKGECDCCTEYREICEHGHCSSCSCANYCWLD